MSIKLVVIGGRIAKSSTEIIEKITSIKIILEKEIASDFMVFISI